MTIHIDWTSLSRLVSFDARIPLTSSISMPFNPSYYSSSSSKKRNSKQRQQQGNNKLPSNTLKVRTITTAITSQPIPTSKWELVYKVFVVLLLLGVFWKVSDLKIVNLVNWFQGLDWEGFIERIKKIVKRIVGTCCAQL